MILPLEQQVTSLALSKRLLQREHSRSILIVDETMSEMRENKIFKRLLRTQEVSLGKRTVSSLLQGMHFETSSRVVSKNGQGYSEQKAEGTPSCQSRVLSSETSTTSLARQNAKYKSIRQQVRMLRRVSAEVSCDRPYKRQWKCSPQVARKQNDICLVTTKQLSNRISYPLSQLQYGYRFLADMPS